MTFKIKNISGSVQPISINGKEYLIPKGKTVKSKVYTEQMKNLQKNGKILVKRV